jgi:hypothetical protein
MSLDGLHMVPKSGTVSASLVSHRSTQVVERDTLRSNKVTCRFQKLKYFRRALQWKHLHVAFLLTRWLPTLPQSLHTRWTSQILDSFAQLPNNPAPLYLSVTSERLIVYVPAVSTVNFISLEQLSVALRQTDRLVTALKALLETSTVTKVFFDARTPAKILFERCGIRLVKEVRSHKADALEVY